MEINGFGQYGGFYNQYNVKQIPQVSTETVEKQGQEPVGEDLESLQNLQENNTPIQSDAKDTRSRNADLENLSLTFHKEDTFDYIGTDSEIGNLDVQKAVSDMKKDNVLAEYQYFVGSIQSGSMGPSEDGMVFPKFNF